MKIGTEVKVERNNVASACAAVLPQFIFWNAGKVKKVAKGRVCCEWIGAGKFWFDLDQVQAQ
jgi:hypothetical protein